MKVNFKLCWCVWLLLANPIYAQSTGSGQGADFTSRGLVSSPGILKRLMEHPKVKQAYDDCKREESCGPSPTSAANTNTNPIMDKDCQDKLSKCVWGKLSQTEQGQILDALNSLEGSGGGRASSEYEQLDLGTVKAQSDRAFIPMRDFFKKQLEQALYGDVKGASNNVVDQAVFLQIYETRVSKNLIETITSFCIDTHPSQGTGNGFHIYKIGSGSGSGSELETNRKAHADLLGSGSSAGMAWSACATDIRNVCTYLASGATCPPQIVQANLTPSNAAAPVPVGTTAPIQGSGTPASACAMNEDTQTAACKVETAMKTARAALTMAAELKTAYGSAFQGGNSFQGWDNKVYTGGSKSGEKTIDEISTVTSKNVETAYGSGAAAEAAQVAQACGAPSQVPSNGTTASPGGNASTFNAATCQKYVMTQEMALKAESDLSEYSLRSKVMQERMKSKLINDQTGEELAKYLKETGMSESEIQSIKSNPTKKDKAIASIIGNYESQRLKIIKDMQDRIAKTSATTATFDQTSTGDAAKLIQQELASEPERYKRVTHYSNLITVFLQKGGSGNLSFTGSAAAEKELGNSALDANTNTQIRTNLANQGLGGGGNTAQQSLIKGETLNNLLLDLPKQ
ncbi:MAG: hypothetical protein HYV97_04255 [Bdellovibrio sp.]|nr:hypothetical protein [Bdellovibrio sp.]